MKKKQKKKNTGIPFERVAQGIFQTMLNRSGVGNVVVEHNKILHGLRCHDTTVIPYAS